MKTIANGVWPVMIAPFTADNRIDCAAVERIIEWYGREGVTGIFVVCQSSGMLFLSREERLSLAKFVIDTTPRPIGAVVSRHGAEDVEDQILKAQAMADMGPGAYVFISTTWWIPSFPASTGTSGTA